MANLQFQTRSFQSVKMLMSCKLKCEAENGFLNSYELQNMYDTLRKFGGVRTYIGLCTYCRFVHTLGT
jgi:hypothetical protein